jgi:hypothetical protein
MRSKDSGKIYEEEKTTKDLGRYHGRSGLGSGVAEYFWSHK